MCSTEQKKTSLKQREQMHKGAERKESKKKKEMDQRRIWQKTIEKKNPKVSKKARQC